MINKTNKERLKKLFQELADLTNPLCGQCRAPYSCCSPEYCWMAIETAKESGETLTPIPGARVPLLGKNGCIAPPWFRPLCTFHLCSINSLGFIPGKPELTEQYFKIREEIDILSMQIV